jgi:hypothetical protein
VRKSVQNIRKVYLKRCSVSRGGGRWIWCMGIHLFSSLPITVYTPKPILPIFPLFMPQVIPTSGVLYKNESMLGCKVIDDVGPESIQNQVII